MSFYDDVTRAKLLLSEQGRVSVKGLMRELGLDQGGVEELIEELVDVPGVARRTGEFRRGAIGLRHSSGQSS